MRERRPVWSVVAVLALGGTVVACSSPAASGAPSETASASASPPADTADCRPLDLVLPSGEPLDLSGSWLANDLGPYQLRQLGDCLWWVGQNATFSIVFFGRLDSDFTVTGKWATLSASDHVIGGIRNPADLYIGTGTLSLQVEVGEQGTNADVRLVKISETDDPEFAPGYGIDVTEWTRVDDDPDHPLPTPESVDPWPN